MVKDKNLYEMEKNNPFTFQFLIVPWFGNNTKQDGSRCASIINFDLHFGECGYGG